MSLLDLIAAADERGLAAGAAACLERCLPQPAPGDEPDPLRPLWAGCADPGLWPGRLAEARAALDSLADPGEPVGRVRELLARAPDDRAGEELRAWADACSVLALEVHLGHDATGPAAADRVARCRAGDPSGAGPLLAGEVARQVLILEMLASIDDDAPAGAGLRQVLDVSTEGQRVLRAAAARRARVRVRR
ncbi:MULTISPECIES: hypothetical protein [unclassified Streptomyces]|uniref:hypothetical protein n=1 Tax=unclassified Streptomyces TaxID=2593676 RepID=UPI002ED19A44|nr:hypothetical protein OH827_21070 [Streptomyces sp. NBC_00891]WSY07344.1 hypothetical protein OG464_21070 [Streptomyces sp. NBC_00890]WSZ08970.1 hypothetical protein OG704_21075 [Streptomyces sp. NBC_00869]WSZ23531.1 hypothetical protein OG498_12495 [Streptomyces sp. NBC_00870]